jgi:hypothetical protein
MLLLEQKVVELAQQKCFNFEDDANWIKKLMKETDNLFTLTDIKTDESFLDTSPKKATSNQSESVLKRMQTLKVKDQKPDTETQ